jgi:H+/Cl- antiporter ClcA
VLIIRTIFVGCGGSGIPAAMIMYHKDPDPLSNASKYVSLRILIGKFLLTWFTLWLGGSAGKVRCEGKGLSNLECLLNPLFVCRFCSARTP